MKTDARTLAVSPSKSRPAPKRKRAPIRRRPDPEPSVGWTYLTNHTHAIIALLREPDIRVRELAIEVGITERAIVRILGELQADGVVEKTREGRRNHYEVNLDTPLRHPLESHCSLKDLVKNLK
jgi:uncharacterized membrane protein